MDNIIKPALKNESVSPVCLGCVLFLHFSSADGQLHSFPPQVTNLLVAVMEQRVLADILQSHSSTHHRVVRPIVFGFGK